jgi:peptidyl-tRNA hydrolase
MTPILYILMRTDLDSMNPGKAMAQASHASNQFVATLPKDAHDIYNEWLQCNGFGTVLVLGVTEVQMRTSVAVANALDLVSDVVHDPTYPLRDGDSTHFIPLDTCAFVFGNKEDCTPVVGNFELHH